MKEYTLKLFTNAYGPQREKSRFTYLNYYGAKVDIPYIVWYIKGADKNILVDSGCSAADYSRVIKGGEEEGFVAGGETFRDVVDVTPFEDGLKKFGITPKDVDTIILTHLHWDHIMNSRKCENAKIYVQKAELEGALYHHSIMDFAYAPRNFYENMSNLEIIKGDQELFPGIRVFFSPGHTPGGQSVAVNTKEGPYIISGFCAIYHNFYPPKEIKDAIGYSIIPPAVHINSLEAYESTLRLVQIAGKRVLPSHEQALMKVEQIPT